MTSSKVTTPTVAQMIDMSGKSLAQIARESELSLSHVSRIRSASRLPSVTTAAKLAVVLDVPLGDLIKAAAAINRPVRRRTLPDVARRVIRELKNAA